MRQIHLLALAVLFNCAFYLLEGNNSLVGDEICDNALDDDLDGLIDLNDPDCDCPEIELLSLIPNPSFEDTLCCPTDHSQLECAVDWIQASEPTTDYIHTCGWLSWTEVPQPFPDGDGCIGFRNGRPGISPIPNWKEYAGACLTAPLNAGRAYRFEFYVGFSYLPHSPPTTIVVYGSPDCSYLPFGVGNIDHGCPLNGPGWVVLDSVLIGGEMEWQLQELEFAPVQDIHAIAIGPNCEPGLVDKSTYYLFDNLLLAPKELFDFKITTNTHPCSDNLILQVPFIDSLTYQWYQNGIALLGETNNELNKPTGNSNYQVKLITPNGCFITQVLDLEIPLYVSDTLQISICEGDSLLFHQQTLTNPGLYTDTLFTANGCDSIITMELLQLEKSIDTVYATIFEGESWRVGGNTFGLPGEYVVNLLNENNCDSLVILFLDVYKLFIPNAFSPNGDGFNDVFMPFSDENIPLIKSMQLFDRWGGLVFSAEKILPNNQDTGWNGMVDGKKAVTGSYVYKVSLELEGGEEKTFTGSFVLIL